MKKLVSTFAAVTTLTAVLLTASAARAQDYAPGQAVEVDMAAINSWESGTVVPFLPGDQQDGYLVRVKVPRYSLYPDGMLVQKIHMRPAAAPLAAQAPAQLQGNAAANLPPKTWEPVVNPRGERAPVAAQPAIPQFGDVGRAPGNPAPGRGTTGFKPGDRVEIDKAKINSWEGATVIPFMDNDPRDGSFYRIRIDNYTTTPHGMLVPVETLRAAAGGGGANLTSHNIGEKVDALCNGLWYSATIVDKKGIDQYKVHYEGDGAQWDEWVAPTRIKAAGQGGPARGGRTMQKAAHNADPGMTPRLNGGVPNIPGTGWDMLSIGKRGEAPSVAQSAAQCFSFSKDGRWSVTRYGLTAGQMGTYKIQGNRLVMTNSLNGEIFGNYAMNWKAGENIMELDDGKWNLRMKLVSTNAYGER